MAKVVSEVTETTVEMTEEAKKETVRKYEDDILGGLLAAAAYKTDAEDITPIEVVRGGATVLTFRIRPMSEEEKYQLQEKQAARYENCGECKCSSLPRTADL